MKAWMEKHPYWTLVIGILLGAFPAVIIAIISSIVSAAFNTVATVAEGAAPQAFNGGAVDDGGGLSDMGGDAG